MIKKITLAVFIICFIMLVYYGLNKNFGYMIIYTILMIISGEIAKEFRKN